VNTTPTAQEVPEKAQLLALFLLLLSEPDPGAITVLSMNSTPAIGRRHRRRRTYRFFFSRPLQVATSCVAATEGCDSNTTLSLRLDWVRLVVMLRLNVFGV
jgi:hypothetical protein